MKPLLRSLVWLAAMTLLAACSDNSSPTCNLNGGTQLAATAWPKFQADAANSGRSPVDLSVNDGAGGVLFPLGDQVIGPTQTTPILGSNFIYLGSSDTNVYVLQYDGAEAPTCRPGSTSPCLEESIMLAGAVTGSPLLGADGTLFVPTNGILAQYEADGNIKNNAALPGFDAASPNIWSGDGTAYTGTLSGGFLGVCPNGVSRYQLSFPATQSAAAVAQDPNVPDQSTPIVVAGGLAGQVRAYNIRGRQRWSFFASATIDAAALIDESTDIFYVADTNGRVFAGNLANGTQMTSFAFAAGDAISASMALGRDTAATPTIYVADEGGTLYALNRATGAIRWTFQAAGPIGSSPAVATGGTNDIVVFGADILGTVGSSSVPVPVDGRVYAVRDDGDRGSLVWSFDAGASIGASSPSIGSDGTVYIGRQGQQRGSGSGCVGGQETCTVSVGGGLYAIGAGAPSS